MDFLKKEEINERVLSDYIKVAPSNLNAWKFGYKY